jgi:hypothetical protein
MAAENNAGGGATVSFSVPLSAGRLAINREREM